MASEKPRMVKTSLVLPQDILESIDELMGKRKRSKFIAGAARKELKRTRLQRALEKAAGAWKDEDHPEIKQKGTHRWVRESREESDNRLPEIKG